LVNTNMCLSLNLEFLEIFFDGVHPCGV
jgi:hypothetical protein